MRTRKNIAACVALAALAIAPLTPSAAQADFGIKSLSVTAINEDGSIDTQAGSHPYEYTVSFEVNQDAEEKVEGKLARLIVDLPAGLVGNPQALPHCSRADFVYGGIPRCSGDSPGRPRQIARQPGSPRTCSRRLQPDPQPRRRRDHRLLDRQRQLLSGRLGQKRLRFRPPHLRLDDPDRRR